MSCNPLFPTKFSVAKAKRLERNAKELSEIEARKVENEAFHFFGDEGDDGDDKFSSIEETHREIMKMLVIIFSKNCDDLPENSDSLSDEPFSDENSQDDTSDTIVDDHLYDLLSDIPHPNFASSLDIQDDDFVNYVDKMEFLTEPSFLSCNNQLPSIREQHDSSIDPDVSVLYCHEPSFPMQDNVKQPALPINYHICQPALPSMHFSWEYENNEWGRDLAKFWLLFNERHGYSNLPELNPVTKSGTKRKEPSISKKNTKGKKSKN